MHRELRSLFDELRPDEYRASMPFSPDILQATEALYRAREDKERAAVMSAWLSQAQPCIFGRIAAQRELINYCFLTDEHLDHSDKELTDLIQARRQAWKSQAEDGRSSAFVIVGLSERLTTARPDRALLEFALALARLYLRRAIEPDAVYHDSVRLWDIAFKRRLRWRVGVNFFGAQGDQRWWHDHRLPGGVGLSMNSVGHLVAAEARRRAIQNAARLEENAGTGARRATEILLADAERARLQQTSLVSLGHALRIAMHTIRNASERKATDACEGWERATLLLRREPGAACPVPEVAADSALREFSVDAYAGWYHTDATIPSCYFEPEASRPAHVRDPFMLDFTYLHAGHGRDYREIARGVGSGRGRP